MKYVFILSLLLFTGCSSLKYVFVAPFDNNEYLIVTQIRTETQLQLKKCNDTVDVKKIQDLSLLLLNYEESLPYNDDNIILSKLNYKIVSSIPPKPSAYYCKEKLTEIDKELQKIQTIIGANR